MKRNPLIFLAMLSFLSCQTTKNLPTVENVDIEKYAGQWYEIGRLPNKFEKGLECVSATYTLKDNGKIEVLNQGYSSEGKQQLKTIKGRAWVPDGSYPGRLKVSFFWPFAGNYYIISLDENYRYALVGDPSRKYLWVLSKTRNLESGIYDELLEIAKAEGFNIDNVVKIKQDCKK